MKKSSGGGTSARTQVKKLTENGNLDQAANIEAKFLNKENKDTTNNSLKELLELVKSLPKNLDPVKDKKPSVS